MSAAPRFARTPSAGQSPALSILMVASEAAPFAKTGGLADVMGALPQALGRLGNSVTLVLPRYRGADVAGRVLDLPVPMAGTTVTTRFREHRIAEGVRAVLVDRPDLYERASLYGAGGDDYYDNPRRFAFLARAALEFARQSGDRFDVLHAHDWQAGLAPVYLRTLYGTDARIGGMATIFTIHNLAYQGLFPSAWLPSLDLDPDVFTDVFTLEGLEYWNQASFLKGGINFSTLVTTVSPTYAKEIQTPELGFGFDGILARRAADLSGVLNGIDTELWDPSRDPFLPEPYDSTCLEKKQVARREVFDLLGVHSSAEAAGRPVIGLISRMVDQKGFDLLAAIAGQLSALDATFVLLGTGEARYEAVWRELAVRHPARFGVRIGFDDRLAHLIEAGADMFLMPSRFEPCGLNQMYSMRYGTVPVVRATGGLADTVDDYDPKAETGTGFTFSPYSAEALLGALSRALRTFRKPKVWKALQAAGMRADFSWDRSARQYVKLYERAMRARRPGGSGEATA